MWLERHSQCSILERNGPRLLVKGPEPCLTLGQSARFHLAPRVNLGSPTFLTLSPIHEPDKPQMPSLTRQHTQLCVTVAIECPKFSASPCHRTRASASPSPRISSLPSPRCCTSGHQSDLLRSCHRPLLKSCHRSWFQGRNSGSAIVCHCKELPSCCLICCKGSAIVQTSCHCKGAAISKTQELPSILVSTAILRSCHCLPLQGAAIVLP